MSLLLLTACRPAAVGPAGREIWSRSRSPPVQNLLVQTHRGAIGIWTTYVDWRSVRRIARQAPVIVPEGLVGRVVRVRSGASVIQLLNDPASTVGAMVQRTRTPGLVEGDAGMALAIGNCGIYPGFPWVCGQRIRYW